MATLKRKDGNAWVTVTEPEDFPTPVPVEITEIDADLVPFTTTSNGHFYPTSPHNGFTDVTVNVPTGGLPSVITAGDTPIAMDADYYINNSTQYTNTGISITIQKAGTYRFKWIVVNDSYLRSDIIYSRLYKNGSSVGSERSLAGSDGSTTAAIQSNDISCNAGDIITLYFKGTYDTYYSGTNYYGNCGMLTACINWNPWS